jgi:large subunit ribosomal protein L4
MLILNDFDKNVILSSRNLQNASVKVVSLLNTYDVLNSDSLLITEKGLQGLVERFN